MKSGADSVGETVTEGADEEKEDNVTTVSYTHLDVYKRQEPY